MPFPARPLTPDNSCDYVAAQAGLRNPMQALRTHAALHRAQPGSVVRVDANYRLPAPEMRVKANVISHSTLETWCWHGPLEQIMSPPLDVRYQEIFVEAQQPANAEFFPVGALSTRRRLAGLSDFASLVHQLQRAFR